MFGRGTRNDEDFAREVESHLQPEADRPAADGLSPEAARRQAERRCGNTAQARERFYYSRRSLVVDHLKQDLRTAVRGIKRYPIACAIAVISLGGGIGATTITLLMRNALHRAAPALSESGRCTSAIAHARQSTAVRAQACSERGWTRRRFVMAWRPPLIRGRATQAGDLVDTVAVRR